MSDVRLPKIRVCVPFPNNGKVLPEVRESLASLRESNLVDCKDNIYEVQGASISVLRNKGVNKGISERCHQTNFPFDYYMCIDSDIEFTPEDVAKLVSHDKDIICGAYQDRKEPNHAVAGRYSGVTGIITYEDFLWWEATGLHKVDWCGAGFLLIKKEVLEKLKYPYFREQVIEYDRAGIPHAAWVGEDVGFCLAAQEAGFEIWCDMDVKVNHLTNAPFVEENEDEFSKLRDKQFSPEEAYKFFMEKIDKTVKQLQLLKSCGDMFYQGLTQYQQILSAASQSNLTEQEDANGHNAV